MQLFENCNFKDFVRLLSAFSPRASRAEQLRFLFDLYDVDGDAAVSRADLLTIMRNRAGSALTCEIAPTGGGNLRHVRVHRS